MKIDLDVDYEIADKIVVRNLQQAIDSLEGDLLAIDSDTRVVGVFDNDPEVDRKMIKKQLKAFRKTLGWFSVGEGE